MTPPGAADAAAGAGRAIALPRPPAAALGRGIVATYLSLVVLIPLAAVVARSTAGGWSEFASAITNEQALAALKLTFVASLIVVAVNALAGTATAWVLVRDEFPGKRLMNTVIDLPFALPTIVAGLTLLALYGGHNPLGLDVAYTRASVVLALLFETLPFVVRAVQPVLLELDREIEEAAASLGAAPPTIFRRIVLPSIAPAILAGGALAFARSVGEFGSVVLLSGSQPFKTEVAAVFIYGQVESGNTTGAAAVSVVLLAVSLLVLVGFSLLARRSPVHAG